MIRAAICEDEPNTRAYLASLIRRQPCPCEIAEYASAGEYLADRRQADLLFLDVALGGAGPDGVALARTLRERDGGEGPLVVFVTGYDRYVFDAFDVGAFQYLLKPVDEERFDRVFARAAERIGRGRGARALTLRAGGRTVPLDRIDYIEGSGHRVIVHLGEEALVCYARLRDLEAEAGGGFCRIHKGYLVSLARVERYGRTEVVLTGGRTLPVSKYRYQEFVRAYLAFLRRGAEL